jgi:hypothetical protein
MARNIDDVKLEIQEKINELIGAENRLYQDQFDLLERNNSSIDSFEQLLRDVKRTVQAINGDLDYTSNAFSKIVEELKIGNKTLQFQETLITKASKIAKEVLEIRKGEAHISTSGIQNLQRENQLNAELLKSVKAKLLGNYDSVDLLEDEIRRLEHIKYLQNLRGRDLDDQEKAELERLKNSKEQVNLVQDQIGELEHVKKQLTAILLRNDKLNKELGIGTQFIAKLFGNSKLFGSSISNAYQTTMQLGQGAKAAGVGFNTMGTFTKLLGNNIKAALGPLSILTFLAEQFIEIFKASDQQTGQLAKDFNITYKEASNLRSELNEIAGLTGNAAVTTKGLQESMVAIGKALGSNAALNEKDLVFMTEMREMAGFTNEELVEMEKFTLATGGNLKDNTKNLLFAAKTTALNNKVLLNEKDIMRDVAKASNAVKLSVIGGAEGLGRAAAQAKALGMNLNQLDNIASGLLDFESSINAELEAQLLTGRNINLEQARLYALNNNMEGLSREIAKNIGTAADFSEMNRLQQEAVAKAVGMTREDLAATLTDQEALRGLSGKAAEDAKKALAGARARGMTEEEIAEAGIEDLKQQQSLQDRFNQTVEKLKEIFVGVAQSLMPILDTLATAFKIVEFMVAPFALLMDIAGKLKPELRGIVGFLTAAGIAALILNGALTFGIGTAIVLTAVGAGITYVKSQTSEAASGPRFAEGGIVTKPVTNATVGEAGPEAIIPLNSPKADKYLNTSADNTNNSSVVAELKEIKNILRRTFELEQRQGILNPMNAAGTGLDLLVDKLGTKVNINTYKVQ